MLLSGCKGDSHLITLDNPQNSNIEVVLNDSSYLVYGYGSKQVTLDSGHYAVKVYSDSDSLLLSKTVFINSDGILNPLESTYVKWTDQYGKYDPTVLSKRDMEIGNNFYPKVDFIIYEKEFFIPKTWDFDLFEPWKDYFQYYFEKQAVKSKIYRIDDLEKTWGLNVDLETQSLSISQIDSVLKILSKKIDEFEFKK